MTTHTTLPSWVESPLQDTEKELIGVGEGRSLARAKEAALNDIAGKLGTHISGMVDREVQQYGDQIKSSSRQVITARINETKLINPRILKTAKYDRNIYVLLAVSRKVMVQDTRTRLAALDQRLRQQWKGLSRLSFLRQFVRVKKLSSKLDQASGLAVTLQALDQDFKSRQYLERYNQYRAKSDTILSKMHLVIRAQKGMRPVAEHLLQLLSEEEIAASVESRSRGSKPVIWVTGEVKRNTAFGAKFSHLTTILELKDLRGQVIARREYKTTGKSSNDYSSATRDAIAKLVKKWNREPVLSVIGLKF